MRRWYDGGSRNRERPTMTTKPERPLRDDDPYLWDLEPQTDLGRLLLECRRELVAKGEPLLDWEGIEREVAERRGGVGHDDE